MLLYGQSLTFILQHIFYYSDVIATEFNFVMVALLFGAVKVANVSLMDPQNDQNDIFIQTI